jgi:hypothetical protein
LSGTSSVWAVNSGSARKCPLNKANKTETANDLHKTDEHSEKDYEVDSKAH